VITSLIRVFGHVVHSHFLWWFPVRE
jgi:hypothetical protein